MNLRQLVTFINKDDFAVARSQQQCVQVGGGLERLPQCLVGRGRQFMPEDGGDLGLAKPWSTDQEAIVEPLVILEAGRKSDDELVDDRLLSNNMGKRGRRRVVQVLWHGLVLQPRHIQPNWFWRIPSQAPEPLLIAPDHPACR